MMRIAKPSILYAVLLLVFIIAGCKQNKKESQSEMETVKTESEQNPIEETVFGEMPDGTKVKKFTLKNEAGMEVEVITYGGIITRWTAPDKQGNYEDIVLGFDDLDQYLDGNPYFGALIGRYGNRIAKGQFSLEGETYTLATNDGDNHLHGGEKGFDKVVWNGVAKNTSEGAVLELTYTSEDGEEGYPGKLDVKVTYTLTDDNALDVQYEAVTDKPTVVNLTQHSYFNLSGQLSEPILDHEIYLNADTYLPVDGGLIPTGEFREVAGTPFDFKEPKLIGKEIDANNEQLSLGGGYDHCWVLNETKEDLGLAASAHHPETGRFLEVYTNEPGIQFYSGNFLDGTLPSKTGGTYAKRSGFCLETQHYPDSPNQADFPSVRLNPGETYSSRTMFKLSTK
ncbi:aldose epimerase family protein [Flagellimonas oceanensis]|uniref:aldose epimerase family protein n=1 Tax=Flagellimonas oceanensis TaxID=2499163 RepID=UPI000F8F1795|nr:aldose epimerase family protein [Allomuricauda oceanensis]|tara:strand:+ start:6308 stop:7495 length:1188 start_codon:yes stop_codon:yes gene_type:complete